MTADGLYLKIKPIGITYKFLIKARWKMFTVFAALIGLIAFLIGYLPFALIPQDNLPDTQAEYYNAGLGFFTLIVLFAVCFFFSGIICSEFSKKTGYIVFPKINKYKLVIGKYLGSLTLTIGVCAVYYFLLALEGVYFYGGPVNIRLYYSFLIAVVYILAVSSFVTFFSSFMKNVNMTIVATILILLLGFAIVDQIIVLANPNFEPIYSLDHLSRLISAVLNEEFPDPRYEDLEIEDFTYRYWITPSIETGILMMSLYAIICLGLAAIIFSKKQL